MSDPFIGEIRMFAGNFAPRGWAFCDGQLLAVSQNNALFSLFGTTYGGDGRTTFGLPELRGRIPIHAGQGPGLNNYRLGQKSGTELVTLTPQQMPSHTHTFGVRNGLGTSASPEGHTLAEYDPTEDLYTSRTPNQTAASGTIGNTGGTQPHGNMMPFLCVNFIVSLLGIYPSRH